MRVWLSIRFHSCYSCFLSPQSVCSRLAQSGLTAVIISISFTLIFISSPLSLSLFLSSSCLFWFFFSLPFSLHPSSHSSQLYTFGSLRQTRMTYMYVHYLSLLSSSFSPLFCFFFSSLCLLTIRRVPKWFDKLKKAVNTYLYAQSVSFLANRKCLWMYIV